MEWQSKILVLYFFTKTEKDNYKIYDFYHSVFFKEKRVFPFHRKCTSESIKVVIKIINLVKKGDEKSKETT